MIEKFTPEELIQIRRELNERDRVSQKDKLLREQYSRAINALDFRRDPELQNSFSVFDVKNALTLLVDHALKNYTVNEKKQPNSRGSRVWKRNPLVPDEIADKYLAAYTRIVDVLEDISEPWESYSEEA